MNNLIKIYRLSTRYRSEAATMPEGATRTEFESAADRLLDLFCFEFNRLHPMEARKVQEILGI